MSINTLQDIFNNDTEGLLKDIEPEVLSVKRNKPINKPATGREVAERVPCASFDEFKPVFDRISCALESKRFSRVNHISAKTIEKGGVFVLNGQLCYVADVYLDTQRKDGEYNERVRLIFANGTESNMLVHSMTIIQYKYSNSYQLLLEDLDDEAKAEGDNERKPAGVIYVARMRVNPDEFAPYNTPHKIGFTVHTGAHRTKNSTKDTAFLCREVDIVSEWQAYGVDPHRIERLIHAFFASRHINTLVTGEDGVQYKATEWFDVPLSAIEKAVHLILQGEAKNYKISELTGEVVPKSDA